MKEIQLRPVLTKNDFVARYSAGEFGNRSPTWSTIQEFWDSNPQDGPLFHLRNRVVRGPTWYNLTIDGLLLKCDEIFSRGLAKYEDLYVSQMAPTERTVIQGEICRLPNRSPYLYYNREQKTIRDATHWHEATGTEALTLLRHYLPQRDYDWLFYLLDGYEGHVVEFSNYAVPFGSVPGFKTCYWEVRQY